MLWKILNSPRIQFWTALMFLDGLVWWAIVRSVIFWYQFLSH
jgi:hypothetical protein